MGTREWMKLAAVLAATGPAIPQVEADEPAAPSAHVRVFDVGGVPETVLAGARDVASEAFERAGIRIVWSTGDPKALKAIERVPVQRAAPGCPSVSMVNVKLGHIPVNQQRGALAYAMPFHRDGVRVTIATERVYAYAGAAGVPVERVLGLVLAHEIGHVLKGTDGHSDSGLMRRQLYGGRSPHDFDANQMHFHPRDLAVIRMNFDAAAAPPPACGTLVAGRP